MMIICFFSEIIMVSYNLFLLFLESRHYYYYVDVVPQEQ